MIIPKIEIAKYETMKYTGLDEKRAVIDGAIAETVNRIIELLGLDIAEGNIEDRVNEIIKKLQLARINEKLKI